MNRVYLNTSFAEKEKVKALGAMWDGAEKRWYVPSGLAVTPFAAWLPADAVPTGTALITPEATTPAAETDKGVALSAILGRARKAMQLAFPETVWVRAEISELKQHASGAIYLTLVEHDASGKEVAQASAVIWPARARQVVESFCKATGADFAAGIKVLLSVRIAVTARNAISLNIEDVDPSFTLGELEAKLRRIRLQLTADGIIDQNQRLSVPSDVFRVVVVSPEDAAGLGDFRSEAARLQSAGICQFSYLSAVFQGERASASVSAAIAEAATATADLLVIIRGGGAVADLHWLSDYACARAVCLSPIPVFVGIGHEKDKTILDEVACRSFGTPSKVVGFIESLIRNAVGTAERDFQQIALGATRMLELAETQSLMLHNDVAASAKHQLTVGENNIANLQASVATEATRALPLAEHAVEQSFTSIRTVSESTLQRASEQADALVASVQTQARQFVVSQSALTEALIQTVKQAATRQIDIAESQAEDNRIAIIRDAEKTIVVAEQSVTNLIGSVMGMGPEQTLKRGFAIAWHNNKPVTTAEAAKQCNELTLQFHDGCVNLSAERKSK